jgi:hypothetical protein
MKILTWNKRHGRYAVDLGDAGWLSVESLRGGEWAWEYVAPSPRDDVRGTAKTKEEAMEKAHKAAIRAGLVEA